MKSARWLIMAGWSFAAMPAAQALPAVQPESGGGIALAQLNCTGPRCLTTGPIRRPYLRGTRPPELPGREMFRRAPERPTIKLQQPEMDYRVPRFDRDRPLVREIRPADPSYRVIGLPEQHIQWCYGRYRSYRQSDNSYQPFSGPRRKCQSPDS